MPKHDTDGQRSEIENAATGPSIEDLQARLLDTHEKAEAITAKADAEKRDLTDDERTDLDALNAEFDAIEGDLDRRAKLVERANRLAASFRKTGPDSPDGAASAKSQRRSPAQPINMAARGSWGWESMGAFAKAVKMAAAHGGHIDPRLLSNAPTSFGSEGVGEDGGFLVPPDFRTAIMEKVQAEESLLGRTDQQVSSSNSFSQPIDETTPWQTSGGIQAYWEGEANQFTQSKPQFQANAARLYKLTALVGVTEELREDAPAIDNYLRSKAPAKIGYKVNDAIIRGTGAGMPLGILNAPALITVAKETSQTADTVHARNIAKMWGRLYAPWRRNAVWLINQDVEQQLPAIGEAIKTADGTTTIGAGPTYWEPGSIRNQSDFGTLYNRPVIPLESCSALGDVGDIILCSLDQYLTVTKIGGIRADVSMHLWFDYDMSAYRFVLRMAGTPELSAPITRANSSNTLSAFVTLAAR